VKLHYPAGIRGWENALAKYIRAFLLLPDCSFIVAAHPLYTKPIIPDRLSITEQITKAQ
jgi:hypothetical protein